MSQFAAAFGRYNPFTRVATELDAAGRIRALPHRDLYAVLESYYLMNDVYEATARRLLALGVTPQSIQGLRNPAFRAVEFYPATVWPGEVHRALPILTTNKAIHPAIQQLWVWSNWQVKKQLAARWFALFGDMFIKVAERPDPDPQERRVFLQVLDPRHVTAFSADERGFLQQCRLDTFVDAATSRENGEWLTEVWTKTTFQQWRHNFGPDTPLESLNRPTVSQENSLGFIPIAWSPFRDIGKQRGLGVFTLEIEKIDEANRLASRLHRMLFRHNKPIWALEANGVDAAGRPLPAPRLIGGEGPGQGGVATETLSLGDDALVRLPGQTKLSTLIPNLDYASALAILQDHIVELERDLPELRYSRVLEFSQVTGAAVRYMLSDAIDRAIEVRGNAESALLRANQMALTIGSLAQIPGFRDIGSFRDGDFVHRFKERPIIPMSEVEQAQAAAMWKGAGLPLAIYLKREGWTDEEIAELHAERDAEAARETTQQPAPQPAPQAGVLPPEQAVQTESAAT